MSAYLLRSLGERAARFLPCSLGWQIVDTLRGELGKEPTAALEGYREVLDVAVDAHLDVVKERLKDGKSRSKLIEDVRVAKDAVKRHLDDLVQVDEATTDFVVGKLDWLRDMVADFDITEDTDIYGGFTTPDIDVSLVPACVEAFLDGLELGLGSREARRA